MSKTKKNLKSSVTVKSDPVPPRQSKPVSAVISQFPVYIPIAIFILTTLVFFSPQFSAVHFSGKIL